MLTHLEFRVLSKNKYARGEDVMHHSGRIIVHQQMVLWDHLHSSRKKQEEQVNQTLHEANRNFVEQESEELLKMFVNAKPGTVEQIMGKE